MSKKLIDPCPNRRYDDIYRTGLEWIASIEYLDYQGMCEDYDDEDGWDIPIGHGYVDEDSLKEKLELFEGIYKSKNFNLKEAFEAFKHLNHEKE